jgi:hypothetical protein
LWNFGVTYSRTKPSRIVDYIILSIPWHAYTVLYTIDYFTFRIIWFFFLNVYIYIYVYLQNSPDLCDTPTDPHMVG